MVFRRASFVFSCPRLDFGAPGLILDPRIRPGQHFGLGTFLGQKMGPGKHSFVMELVCGEVLGEST